MARYTFDPSRSRFTVQAFATGLLSAFAHSPTFAVQDLSGAMSFDDRALGETQLDLIVRAGSLRLEDRVREADRTEIESRMRREVLEAKQFPEITFHAEAVSADPAGPGQYRLGIGGRFSLHGVERPIGIGGDLEQFEGGLRLRGGCPVRLSEFGIRPVTALGGAIRLKDDLRVSFDLVAQRETS